MSKDFIEGEIKRRVDEWKAQYEPETRRELRAIYLTVGVVVGFILGWLACWLM